MQPETINLAIPTLIQWVSGKDVSDTTIYKKVMQSAAHSPPVSEERGRSLALRLLIHYVGDIHQPLHNSARYTSEYPEGDKGGNDLLLKSHYTAKNLHSVWDTMIYTFYKTIYRPFNIESWDELGDMAKQLRSSAQISDAEA